MFTLSPVTLVLNTASLVDFNQNQATVPTQAIAPDQVLAVKVTNESPYALLVTGPGTDQQTWLAPWTEDVYFPGGSPTTHLSLLPQSLPGGVALPGSPQSSAALVAVYVIGDPVPHGQWPMALSRQLAVGNQLNTVTQATWFVKNTGVASGTLTYTTPTPTGGQRVYLLGFHFTTSLPSGAEEYVVTITGLAGNGLQYYSYAASTTSVVNQFVNFPEAVPANNANQAVTITQSQPVTAPQNLIAFGYIV